MSLAVYDDEAHTPESDKDSNLTGKELIKPTLPNSMAGTSNNGLVNSTSSANAGKQSSSKMNPSELLNAEKNSTSASGSGVVENKNFDLEGNFWKSNQKGGRTNKLAALTSSAVKGNRKFLLGGGIGGFIILLVFLGFAAFIPYELVHIEETLIKYESKVEMKFEKEAAQHIFQKIINRHLGKTPEEESNAATKEEASGADLEASMDSFDTTNPTVVDDLAKVGINVKESADGAFEGLTDSDNNNITNKVATDPEVFDDLETALPEWDVGQIESFRPFLTDQAGSSWSGLSDTEQEDFQKSVEDKLANGANQEDLNAATTDEDEPAPKDSSQAVLNEVNGGISDSGQVGNGIKAEEADLANGGSEASALTAGEDAIKGNSPLLASSILTDACSVKNAASSASKSRVPTILKLLIRHGTLLISLADELKSGKLSGNSDNKMMEMLGGNPDAKSGDPDSQSFAASAGWQSAIGSQGGVPMDESSLPIKNEGTDIVNQINSDLPGSSFSCSLLTGAAGGFIQGLMGVGQFVADDFSFGATQVGITVLGGALNATLSKIVIPDILKYFTPVGLIGAENSTQWLNNSDAGLNVAFGTYSRRLGANPQTNTSADNLYSEASEAETVQYQQLPILDRMFALSDPNSITSHIVNELPIGVSANIYNIANFFSSLPSILGRSLISLFIPKLYAQTTPTNPGEPYGIVQYAFNDGEVNQYDPVANEQYLLQDVSYHGNSVSRLTALGNPNTYQDSVQGDTNTNDLLHCYVDSFAEIMEDNPSFDPTMPAQGDPGSDHNCGAIGMYDYTSASPNNVDMPNDQTVASIYCLNLDDNAGDQNCIKFLLNSGQVNNDVGHYRQYLLDTHVMSDYMSLTNDQ